jgi:Protein of unknown function (DUF2505)
MARSFDMSADFDDGVEAVLRVFADEAYWLSRLDESGVDVPELETLQVGGESGTDGTIKVVTLQTMLRQNLPAAVTQLHKGDLCVRREEIWGPVTDGAATASIAGSILNAPLTLTGTAALCPLEETGGARLTVRITVQVRIPIIGGKLERLVGAHVTDLVETEQKFTTTWIADKA